MINQNIHAPTTNQRAESARKGSSSRLPNSVDLARWQELFAEPADTKHEQDLWSTDNTAHDAEHHSDRNSLTEGYPGLPPGDYILRGLHSSAAEPAPPPDTSSASIVELAERLAQRILVSTPTQSDQREVRIQLHDGLAANAEFRVTHDVQGVLQVTVIAPPEGMTFWRRQQGDLQRHLRDRLPDTVRVNLYRIDEYEQYGRDETDHPS